MSKCVAFIFVKVLCKFFVIPRNEESSQETPYSIFQSLSSYSRRSFLRQDDNIVVTLRVKGLKSLATT